MYTKCLNLFAVAATLLGLVGCGDLLRAPTEEELAKLNVTYLKPEELQVEVVSVDPSGEKIFIVDVSGSIKGYLGAFGDEVMARAARDETTAVCVQQIANDSQSSTTPRLCLPPIVTKVCRYNGEVKPNNYFNTVEEKSYAEAKARLESELEGCNAQLEVERNGVRDAQDTRIRGFLKGLQQTTNTDIFGAFAAVQDLTQCKSDACTRIVWVYSDMKDDPKGGKRTTIPTLALSDVPTEIRVRAVTLEGESYEDNREQTWTGYFNSWGVSSVEWKNFQKGEASVSGSTEGVVSGGKGEESAGSVLRTERPADPIKDAPVAPPTRKAAPPVKQSQPTTAGRPGHPKRR